MKPAIDILEAIQWALEQGHAPSMILDENSPLRDDMREALKPQAPPSEQRIQITDKPTAIIGWAVHSGSIETAALYPLSKRDDAFDAAKRWGASITALAAHPNGPTPQSES